MILWKEDPRRGRLVARQDSDDVSQRDRLERQVSFLASHPDVAAVGTWAAQLDEDGHQIGLLKTNTDPAGIRTAMAEQNQFFHGSLMFRKRVLDEMGGYRTYFEYAQDYDLTLRLGMRFDLANLPLPLYGKRHRRQALSITHAAEQKSYSDLARALHEQRIQRGSDDLEAGNAIHRPVGDAADAEHMYEQSLVYLYLRSDRCHRARPYILNSIRASPFKAKHYLQYAFTFLNKGLQDKVVRLWDQRLSQSE